ncbi:hypothetical protein NBRC3222_2563 [Acetobacter pasteurianus NBRC 3222]|nr:hypothetical protein NBRC3222_2563 [Acetobacter pasteurianus NBRC 3222]
MWVPCSVSYQSTPGTLLMWQYLVLYPSVQQRTFHPPNSPVGPREPEQTGGIRLFSAVSATDQVSRMQTSASTIFRFICTNKCDTYVHTRKEALYVCCYIPGR